jgi:hypothetical protein
MTVIYYFFCGRIKGLAAGGQGPVEPVVSGNDIFDFFAT